MLRETTTWTTRSICTWKATRYAPVPSSVVSSLQECSALRVASNCSCTAGRATLPCGQCGNLYRAPETRTTLSLTFFSPPFWLLLPLPLGFHCEVGQTGTILVPALWEEVGTIEARSAEKRPCTWGFESSRQALGLTATPAAVPPKALGLLSTKPRSLWELATRGHPTGGSTTYALD